MADTFRDLCAELASNLQLILNYFESDECGTSDSEELIDRTRTLLAQPEPEGLTQIALQMLGTIESMELIIPEITDTIRKALEQGRPTPQPPADGEVGELVEWLTMLRDRPKSEPCIAATFDHKLTRVVELLQRLASPACLVITPSPEAAAAFGAAHIAPGPIERLAANMQLVEPAERTVLVPVAQPVAVSERLPESGDCDELDNCWQWEPDINGHHPLGEWKLLHRDWLSDPDGDTTHWLPANALPLPPANDT